MRAYGHDESNSPFSQLANAPKMIYKSWQVVMAYFKVPLQQPSE